MVAELIAPSLSQFVGLAIDFVDVRYHLSLYEGRDPNPFALRDGDRRVGSSVVEPWCGPSRSASSSPMYE